MIRSGGFSMGDWVAPAGFVLTIALLILNLKVSGAMSDMKTALQSSRTEFSAQLSDVKISVEKLRGDLYQEHAKLYAQVMEKGNAQYMGRELSLQMHTENLERLKELGKRIDDLTTRVGDIS